MNNPFFSIEEENIKTAAGHLIERRKAVINADNGNNVISVVSKNYEIVPNQKLITDLELYLKKSDIKFQRLSAKQHGKYQQRFSAKYKFPEVKSNFGERKTKYGIIPDDVQMMLIVNNSYDGSKRVGFEIGGYRLICLNGMRVYDSLFRFDSVHTSRKIAELEETKGLSIQTAVRLFKNEMSKSWEELANCDFDQQKAVLILEALEMGKRYKAALAGEYDLRIKNKTLKTMWDFYNMITWFSTHIVENRNQYLAQQISSNAYQMLINQEG